MARILESTFLSGPEGRLEALHEGPEGDTAITKAAVLCHPHPQFGGTMHNKAVFRLAKAARRAGAAVLRFNYRGVGASAGRYDGGRGEQDDLRAALGYMRDRYPGLPLIVGGFSFGSRVALRVCCGDPRVERVLAVGSPVDHGDWDFLASCGCPKRFIQSTNDEHGSHEKLEAVYAAAAEPKALTWVESADHFFADALDELESAAFDALCPQSEEVG